MSFHLQQFGINESAYERPTQTWVCGWAADGHACRIGPDRRGRCRATFACKPIKQGDRWQCTRPAGSGGRCPDGPLPDGTCCLPIARCQPVRSLRARRGLVVALTVALTAAGLVTLALGPWSQEMLSPGPLASAHANILAESGQDAARGCGACHAAAGSPNAWLVRVIDPPGAAEESQRCVACHALRGDMAAHALDPHTMSPQALSRIASNNATDTAGSPPLRLALARSVFGSEDSDDVACAACHHEHRGRHADLKHLSESECQACHARQFESFLDGHPEFSADYPHTRRTRIKFNHSRHHFQHFPSTGAVIECTDCHELDHTRRHMIVKGFDAACASCHSDSIRTAPPVAFAQLPSIDLESLPGEGAGLGIRNDHAWPWSSDVDDEIDPSQFLNLLLGASEDPAVAAALAHLEEESLDLYDLSDAEDDSLAHAERLIWAVRELFVDLTSEDEAAMRQRLALAMAPDTGAPTVDLGGLIGAVPHATRHPEQEFAAVLKAAQAAWFSGAASDVRQYRQAGRAWKPTDADATPGSADPPPAPPKEVAAALRQTSGWNIDRSGQAINYIPSGHADAFLRAWIDAAGRSPNPRARAIFAELMDQKKDPGNCSKCHSVDQQPDGTLMVHWTGRRPWTRRQELTRFAHGPHFNEPSLQNCAGCHDVLRGGDKSRWDSAYAWEQFDPAVIAPHLSSIDRANCARCHTPTQAGFDCLTCHSYHHSPLTAQPISARLGQRTEDAAASPSSPP